jgi:hypothetical protein
MQINTAEPVFTNDELKKMVKLDSMPTETLRLESTATIIRLNLDERDHDVYLPIVDGRNGKRCTSPFKRIPSL